MGFSQAIEVTARDVKIHYTACSHKLSIRKLEMEHHVLIKTNG